MSTKNITDTSNQYNSNAMNTYNAFQPNIQSMLQQFTSNPLASSYFKNQLAQSMNNANQLTARSNSNILSNLRTGGGVLSGSGGLTAAMLNRSNLQGMNLKQGAFQSSLNTALNNRTAALQSMQAYQPLQTGQTSTSYKTGTGTWLPQVIGAAANVLLPGVGSMLAGGSFLKGLGGGMMGGLGGGGGSNSGGGGTPPFISPTVAPPPNYFMQQNYPNYQMPSFNRPY